MPYVFSGCRKGLGACSRYLTGTGIVCIIYEVTYMRIRIAALGKIGSSLDFEEVVGVNHFPELTQIGESQTPLQIKGTVLKTKFGFLVSGAAEMSLTLTCSRCLTPFEQTIKADFSEEYVPAGYKAENPEPSELEDPAHTFQGDYIDITRLVTEAVILEIPMKAVCRNDCKGICPECGQVLNEKVCDCDKVQPDPRLAVLADLLKNQ